MGNIVITSSPITMICDFVNPMGSDQAGDVVLWRRARREIIRDLIIIVLIIVVIVLRNNGQNLSLYHLSYLKRVPLSDLQLLHHLGCHVDRGVWHSVKREKYVPQRPCKNKKINGLSQVYGILSYYSQYHSTLRWNLTILVKWCDINIHRYRYIYLPSLSAYWTLRKMVWSSSGLSFPVMFISALSGVLVSST